MSSGEFRRPRPEEREAFDHLQERGYASGGATLVRARRQDSDPGQPAAAAGGAPEPEGGADEEARAYFVGGRPVAGACLKRYDTWWGATDLPMESVGGVVTLPEARRRGYTAQVMAALVGDMRERGVPVSTITTPFSYAFYRRAGWEYAFRRVRARFAPRVVAGIGPPGPGEARFVRYEPASQPLPADLDAVYRRVMRERYQGAAARPADLWRQHLRGEHTYAYVWEGPCGPAGYAVCAVRRDDVVTVRELFALDEGAQRGLFGLLANFDSQAERVEWDMPPDVRLDLLVPEQNDVEMAWQAEGMFRIVDLPAAVAARRAGSLSGRLRLRLQDEQAPWNRGPFDVEWSDGWATVRPAPGREAGGAGGAAMDQRVFAQIYAGTITPREAVRLRQADIGEVALALLTDAYVTGRPPLLLEWF